ncbi:hypothetical protein [Paracoccus sediminicola]|uniref:hypothetical protein n=1 Tax=Paracoccus sediminicola TaxID=3017783 RepID=UPI0022EFFB37|nr:hypothetical protein [Paracoccus sediminicola]WBU57605.1 hypothetical protein PAF18_03990 [Paracoccus sediminicola]
MTGHPRSGGVNDERAFPESQNREMRFYKGGAFEGQAIVSVFPGDDAFAVSGGARRHHCRNMGIPARRKKVAAPEIPSRRPPALTES